MKTLRKPLTIYVFVGMLMSLIVCLLGSAFPLDRWRDPLNALFNVLFGTMLLVISGVFPSAVATSLILLPAFRQGHFEPVRKQILVFTVVGVVFQIGFSAFIAISGGFDL